jgi:macrolide transport system ATP-binding/permease protein
LTVGPAFFSTMQVPILAGREIDERDRPGSPAVAIINEVFAKANFGDLNPLGQHLTLRDMQRQVGRDMEIVGVAKNALYGYIKDKIPPVIYMPYDQGYPPPREMVYALRTAGDPLAYVKQVREIVHQEDPRLPVSDVKTQAAEINETINDEITLAELCTALAILALVIACVGLYGVVSYNVSRRTGEIGIRMALGARRGVVVWMVLRQVLLIAAVGLGIGVPLALAASRFVEAFLFGMKPNDPVSLALAVAILLCAGLLAGYIPARRAARIDPMAALRHE